MFLTKLFMSLFMLMSCSYNMFVAKGSYCLFLMSLSLISSLMLYCVTSSFWYCCMLLLIYMGGVYVLLLFVSMYSYNSYSYSVLGTTLFMMLSLFVYLNLDYSLNIDLDLLKKKLLSLVNDESLSLLTKKNWVSYMLILSSMVLSMVIFTFMFADKSYFMR